MAHQSGDRIRETTTTTGTGTITLAGAVTNCRAFSDICSNNDTVFYAIVDDTNNTWEVGLGTWQTGNLLARTAGNVISGSSGAGALVNFAAATKQVFNTIPSTKFPELDNVNVITLPIVTTASPTAPNTNNINLYADKIAGRPILKVMGDTGKFKGIQESLWGAEFQGWYWPNTGTTVGLNTGLSWTSGGTVSHPTPASTAPAIVNQMRRTRWANVATTQNQQLGLIQSAAAVNCFWRGNAAGLGGFFFFSRFIVELYPAATIRLFMGLTSLTTSMVASDTPSGDFVGLWHDTTDGATVLSLITMDNTTRVKTAITGTPTMAASQAYEFTMYCPPNGSTIYYELWNINAGTMCQSTSYATTLPRSNIFMGSQAVMSNGTANTAATTTALGLSKLYVACDGR